MSRALWKSFYFEKVNPQTKLTRSVYLSKSYLGMKILVHRGNRDVELPLINNEHLGCKLGDFVFTKSRVIHTVLKPRSKKKTITDIGMSKSARQRKRQEIKRRARQQKKRKFASRRAALKKEKRSSQRRLNK